MRNYFNILFITISATILISAASAQDYSREGAEIYIDYCEACHMVGGEGYEDIYPALKNNALVLGDQEELIYLLLEGRAGMPTFIDDLEVMQLTTVINFIRNSWGNLAGEINHEQMNTAYEEIAEEDDGFGSGN